MQRSINTQAIILNKKPIGENDVSITLYCPSLGKIYAIAKGARKIASHWSGHLEPMNLCQMQLYKSATRFTVTQCLVEQNFKNIYKSVEALSCAMLILEIFQKSTYEHAHSQALFDLIHATFQSLNHSRGTFLALERFKLHLLKLNGTLPNMTACVFCHRRWNALSAIWLDPNGHLSCGNCVGAGFARTDDLRTGRDWLLSPCKRISFEVIKLVCYLLEKNSAGNIKIRVSTSQKQQLQLITHTFLQHFINREIIGEKIHEKMTVV